MNRVLFFSRNGCTEKLAKAIAQSLDLEAEAITKKTGLESTNVLFLGASIYAGKISPVVRDFLKRIRPEDVKVIAVFYTSFTNKTPMDEIRSISSAAGLNVAKDNLYIRGPFLFMNKNHPNEGDFHKAQEFAQKIISEYPE